MEIINRLMDIYGRVYNYLESADLVVFIVITMIILYFLMYLVSFFFQLPVIIMFGVLIGYYFYTNKKIIKV